MPKDNTKQFVKIGEASDKLGVSIDTLRRWEKAGKIEVIRTPGGTRLYAISTLKELISAPLKYRKSVESISLPRTLLGGTNKPQLSTVEELLQHLEVIDHEAQTESGKNDIFIDEREIEPEELSVYAEAEIPSLREASETSDAAISQERSSRRFAPQDDRMGGVFSHKIYALTAFSGLITCLIVTSLLLARINNFQGLFTNTNKTTAKIQDFKSESGVLAAETAGYYLNIKSDTAIEGDLAVGGSVNGLTLTPNTDGFTLAGGTSASRKLTVLNGDVTLDQDVSTKASPSFVDLKLTAAAKQINMGGAGTLTWTPTGTQVITFPNATGNVVLDTATQTITNKTLSGSSNTFSSIPNSALSNPKITVTAGTNLSGGGDIDLGSSATLSLKGDISLTSIVATGDIKAATFTGTSYLTLSQTTAPSTTTNKLYNVSGALLWNGVDLSSGGAMPVGTSSQTMYHNGTAWTATSNLFNDGTNVGIGTILPGGKLGVAGGVSIGTYSDTAPPGNGLIVSGNVGFGTNSPLGALDVLSGVLFVPSAGTNVGIGTTSPGSALQVNGATAIGSYAGAAIGPKAVNGLVVSGNIGIGTTNPGAKLHIFGDTANWYVNPNQEAAYEIPAGILLSGNTSTTLTAGALGTAGSNIFQIAYWDSSAGGSWRSSFEIANNSGYGNLLLMKSGGNVGIGITNPGYKLDLATSTASDRGINIANTAATGTNYGIYSSVTGSATANIGGYFQATGATTSRGLEVAAMTSATSTGLTIGALSGTTADTGISIGAISGTGATGTGITIGNISTTGTTNYGLLIGAVSGASANYGLYTTSGTTVLNATSGNVGIGTTSPLGLLHVAGQCVTGDTKLKRRRRKKRHSGGEGTEPIESDEVWEDVRIDEIKPGDEILTLDESTGEFVASKIKALQEMGIRQTYQLITDSGKTIRTTANHPYLVKQQKTTLSDGSLTENSTNALRSDLSTDNISQNTDNVNYVDLTGIEPANSEFLDPNVHQYQAHIKLLSQTKHEWVKVSQLKPGMEIATFPSPVIPGKDPGSIKIDSGSEAGMTIKWEKITSIKEFAREQVFDIEVEGTHNFVGNNIVAHNTAIFGAGEGSTPTVTTLRGAAGAGTNIAGANFTFDASNGTGTGGSGALIFRTAPVAASSSTANTLAEIMRITPGGNVGIGTTNPQAALEVGGSGNVRIGGLTASQGVYTDANKQLTSTAPTSGTLGFWQRNSTYVSPATITDSVGIGTTSPVGKFDVTDTSNTAASFTLTNNTATTIGNGGNTLGVLDLQSTSLTTGNFMNIELNALSSGKGLNLTTTSTALSSGSLASFDWSPTGSTNIYATGDLVSISTGNAYAFPGSFLNIKDNGSSIFSISQTALTASIPASFTSAGDVSIAYDLNFTNPTASYIKSAAPLYLQSGESFNSSDLTLQTFNSGNIILQSNSGNIWADGTNVGIGTTAPASKFAVMGSVGIGTTYSTIVAAPANGLIVEGNVGIGTTSPSYKLDIATSTASDRGINIANTAATGTNYGIYSSVTGASTANYGGYFVSTGATTNYGLSVAALTGATSYGLDIGALSGATANYGVNIGNITSAAAANNFGLKIGTITSQASATSYGISTGAISGAGTATYGLNLGANSSTATTNYGINIGALSGAGTTSYGLLIGAVSGASANYGLYTTSGTTVLNATSGNVGIGITNPIYLFSLVTNDSTITTTGGNGQIYLQNNSDANTAVSSILFAAIGSTRRAQISAGYDGATYAGFLSFTTRNSNTNFYERMRIDSGGNVGIGTTSPLGLLHVAGQCVTGDTKLKRRRRKKRHSGGEGTEPIESDDEILSSLRSSRMTEEKDSLQDDEVWEDVRIDEIKPGDEILTLDESTGEFVASKIKALQEMGIHQTYLLITDSGKTIRTTANHPYLVKQQKTTLSDGSLTENSTNALRSDLSTDNISQNTDNVNYVDLTGIEPANSEFLDPNVHQYQAHIKLLSQTKHEWVKVSQLKPGMEIATFPSPVIPGKDPGSIKIDSGSEAGMTIKWEKITSIKEFAREQVFDIEVEGTHNFVGNNIVAHNTAIFGAGEGSTPTTTTLRGAAGAGTDIAGANFTFDASNGTGTGGSGALIFRTAPVAASSSTANTLAEIMRITPGGNVGIGTTAPASPLAVTAPTTFTTGTLSAVNAPASTLTGALTGLNINVSGTTPGTQSVTALSTSAFTGGGDGTTNYGFNIGAVTGSGTSTNYGGYIGTISGGSTNNIGLRITGTAAAAANYAVYADSAASNYFAGNIGIGTTSATYQLRMTGSALIAGNVNAAGFFDKDNGNYFLDPSAGASGKSLVVSGNVGIGTTAPVSLLDVNQKFNVLTGGNVGIGTTNPGYQFQVQTATNEGHVSSDGTWGSSSDLRLKTNITSLDNSLDKIIALNGISYDSIGETPSPDGQGRHLGFIAQEVELILPELVSADPNTGYKAISYGSFAPVLAEAIKELNQKISLLQDSYKLDDKGRLIIPEAKIDKLIISGDVDLSSTIYSVIASTAKQSSTVDKIATDSASLQSDILQMDSRLTGNDSAIAETKSQVDVLSASIASTSTSLSTAIASMSAQIASLSSVIPSAVEGSSTSAEIASNSATASSWRESSSPVILEGASPIGSDSIATPSASLQNDVVSLNLTPPEILLATTSAHLVDLTVTSDATISGKLTAYDLSVQNNFKSLGEAFLGNTTVAGSLTVDGTMSLTGNSLNSIACHNPVILEGASPIGSDSIATPSASLQNDGCGTLFIQNSPFSDKVDFFNGLAVIDKTGKLFVQKIELPAEVLGTAIIPAGQTEIPVFTTSVTDKSKIFLTLLSSTSGQAPFISAVVANTGFVVKLDDAINSDIKFNWLLIDQQ